MSQRHFRERRNQHIKELEERVQVLQMNGDQRNAALIDENTKLRASLSLARVQLARLKSLFDELGTTLGPIGSLPTRDASEAASDGLKNPEVRRAPRSRTLLFLYAYCTEKTPTLAAPASSEFHHMCPV